MQIAFDVDGVVIRSIEIILEHINFKTGQNLSPEDLKTWDLDPLGIERKILAESVDKMFAAEYVEPYEGAVETLSDIYRSTGEPLLFITGRSDPKTALRQLKALHWKSGTPEMIVTGGDRDKKTYLAQTNADFIIEDDILHLQSYLDIGIGVGLMVQPWNRHSDIPVTHRFDGWRDICLWFNKNNNGKGESSNCRFQ
jgi:hypothetical protein